MAKRESQRWKGWRTGTGPAPIKGDQPTKRPGTRRKKRAKLYPWYWIRNLKPTECGGCGRQVPAGEVIAFSRPKKFRCESCVEATGLEPKVSRKLAEERRAKVMGALKKAAGK